MPHFRSGLLAALLLCGLSATAVAAPAKPASAPQPVSADPAATTAAYGDWVLRCQRVNDKTQLCEVAQTIQMTENEKTLPIAQIAFTRSKPSEPLRVVVLLPSNITLPSSAALALTEKDPRPVDLSWRRCIPGGCVAEAQPPAESLKPLLAATEPGRLSYTDSTGRVVALPLSLRGLTQALEALNKS